MNSFEFASVLLLAFGVYILYACVQLKVSGEPTKGVMVDCHHAGASGSLHLLYKDDFLRPADLYFRAGYESVETEKESK